MTGEYIWTYSGKRLYFDDPTPSLDINDIAHALSQLCRWTGHTRSFYSIAQHCVLVSEHVTPGLELLGLLHDAAEAYVNDLSKPLKISIAGEYAVIEDRLDAAIYAKFGLTVTAQDRRALKCADLRVAVTEARDLLHQVDVSHYNGAQPLPSTITPWSPVLAQHAFLDRFQELTCQRTNLK
jgi:5'-deoxynucleotidase YfbR-like HD superfamily hydrolase